MNWWKPLDPKLPGSPYLAKVALDYYNAPKGPYCFKAQTIAEALAITNFVTDSGITKLTQHPDNLKLDMSGKYIQVCVEWLGSHIREIVGETASTYVSMLMLALHQACYIDINPATHSLLLPISVAGKQNELVSISTEFYEGLSPAERLLFVYLLQKQLLNIRPAISAVYCLSLEIAVSGDNLENCVVNGYYHNDFANKGRLTVNITGPEGGLLCS